MQKSSPKPSATLLWGRPNAATPRFFVKDRTWCLPYTHENASGVTIKIKCGNNNSALDSVPRGTQSNTTSEQGLHKKYSSIYPVGNYYFVARVFDDSKDYKTTTAFVCDLRTAYAVFGQAPLKTRDEVRNSVDQICSEWNNDYGSAKKKKWDARSHINDYLVVSSGKVEKRNPLQKSGGSKEEAAFVESRVVLVTSNWHFVRDRRESKNFEPCEKRHCTVALKLDSSQFAKPDSKEDFHFDRNGLVLPYDAFLSLIKDTDFTGEYLQAVREKFESETGEPISKTPKFGKGDEEEEEEEEEEDDEKQVLGNRKKRRATSDSEIDEVIVEDEAEGLGKKNKKTPKKRPPSASTKAPRKSTKKVTPPVDPLRLAASREDLFTPPNSPLLEPERQTQDENCPSECF